MLLPPALWLLPNSESTAVLRLLICYSRSDKWHGSCPRSLEQSTVRILTSSQLQVEYAVCVGSLSKDLGVRS